MENVLQYWPIIFAAIGLAVWSIRLEGLVKQNTKDLEDTRVTNDRLFATKVEFGQVQVSIATVAGAVSGLGAQLRDVQTSNQRIESKVDALLVGKAESSHRTV